MSVAVAALACAPLSACATDEAAGASTEHPALGVAPGPTCVARGGTLAFVDGATGEPAACRVVKLTAGAERFEGETDARGLVPVELPAGARVSFELAGFGAGEATIVSPLGPELPMVELWPDGQRPVVRLVEADDGLALQGVEVSFVRAGIPLWSGRSNALGALVGTPANVEGSEPRVPGYRVARFDAASRTLVVAFESAGD